MLKMEGISAGYGELSIIEDVALEVGDGEIVTIIGPNGAGKSTLMKTVFGLTKLNAGKIFFRGEDATGLRPDRMVRLGIAYVPPERNIFPSLSVRENLAIGAYVLGCYIDKSLHKVSEIFPELEPRMNQSDGTMSGGEQKMLAIGRTLVVDSALLLLDEPSAALSPRLTDEVFSKIQEINRKGTAILKVEQNARKAQ
jgi:ABC-type branched-subunit amino acid transport system ATPase component